MATILSEIFTIPSQICLWLLLLPTVSSPESALHSLLLLALYLPTELNFRPHGIIIKLHTPTTIFFSQIFILLASKSQRLLLYLFLVMKMHRHRFNLIFRTMPQATLMSLPNLTLGQKQFPVSFPRVIGKMHHFGSYVLQLMAKISVFLGIQVVKVLQLHTVVVISISMYFIVAAVLLHWGMSLCRMVCFNDLYI